MAELKCMTMGMFLWILVALLSHTTEAQLMTSMLNLFSETGTIVKFRLINADTDLPIMDITNNQIVILPLTNATSFNIEAVTEGAVGSIRFGFLGNNRYRVESRSPFALCGDDWLTGNYKACPDFTAGRHDITATPYSLAYELGEEGMQVSFSFTVVTDLPLTTAPVKPPTSAPVIPTKVPTRPPQKPPTKPPTKVPLANTPIKIPTVSAPIKPISPTPVNSPQRVPTNPVPVPLTPTMAECKTPKVRNIIV